MSDACENPLDTLLGRPVPAEWPAADWIRVATGRAPLPDDYRATLGADAARLPLLR